MASLSACMHSLWQDSLSALVHVCQMRTCTGAHETVAARSSSNPCSPSLAVLTALACNLAYEDHKDDEDHEGDEGHKDDEYQ